MVGDDFNDRDFLKCIATLKPKVQTLLEMSSVDLAQVPIHCAGIYLFSENGVHLYVGRSNNIRRRVYRHYHGGVMAASFAFRLARVETGNLKATYKKGKGSRKALVQDSVFAKAFDNAMDRIRRMELRFVEEVDPLNQGLLEIYVAVGLKTPFNDFDTH